MFKVENFILRSAHNRGRTIHDDNKSKQDCTQEQIQQEIWWLRRSRGKTKQQKEKPVRGWDKKEYDDEEDEEDDDDDDDGETVSMASFAIATTPRVSLFDSPDENITSKCIMAKAQGNLQHQNYHH